MFVSVSGTGGTVVLEPFIQGCEVCGPDSRGFAFVSFGFSGPLIFAFYHVRGLSGAVAAAVVISANRFIAASAYVTMLQAVLFSFGLNIPVVAMAFLLEPTCPRCRMLLRSLKHHAEERSVAKGGGARGDCPENTTEEEPL